MTAIKQSTESEHEPALLSESVFSSPGNQVQLLHRVRKVLAIVFVLLLATSCISPSAPTKSTSVSVAGLSLRSLAQARKFYIGAAVNVQALRSEAQYREVLAREFNILTPENAMKFASTQPGRHLYTFQDADTIVTFAKAHAMQIRGHNLVWYKALPSWLINGNFSRQELIAILHEHISTVVSHYRGQISAWDVVNEALNDDGTFLNSLWLRTIGPDYIDMAFRWAHEADPHASLFYNDYDGEGLGRKSDAIYALVKGLLQRGVPINGVGLQMHVSLDTAPRPQDVLANMKRLAALGLKVQITEMDVEIQHDPGSLQDKLAAEATLYRNMLSTCLAAPNCTAFVMWGFTDRYSWIPLFTGHQDAPLIFDASYRPKPAYNALHDVFSYP